MKYPAFFIILLVSISYSQILPSGSGTSDDPYIINSLGNLQWVSENSSAWSAYYLQTSDIDASSTATWNSGAGWSPIGTSWETAFFGSYNGGGHTISGLTIYRNGSNQAFIGIARDAVIQNLTLSNVSIETRGQDYRAGALVGESATTNITNCHAQGTVKGMDYVGGLIGYNSSTVTNCSFTGSVGGNALSGTYQPDDMGGLIGYNTGSIEDSYSFVSVSGNWHAGGLVGYNNGGTIERCYSECPQEGHIFGGYYVGGLVGYNNNSGSIINSYSSADALAYTNITGGLIGCNSNSSIINCYSTGSATRFQGGEGDFGSFIGRNQYTTVITNCYSTGSVIYNEATNPTDKGFIGNYNATGCSGNFFDTQTSAQSGGAGAAPKSTAEMKTLSTFTNAGWDFTDIWGIDGYNNSGYPFLQWQSTLPVPPSAPENLAIIYSSSEPELSWSAVQDANSYKIYSSADPYADFVTWTLETTVAALNWTDPNTTGTKKFYIVVAVK